MTVTPRERGFGDCRKPDFRATNIVRIEAAGIKLNVHRDIDLLVICFVEEMANLHGRTFFSDDADDWGWNFRPIRGREKEYERLMRAGQGAAAERMLSNHSGGTAIDLEAATNRQGSARTTFKVPETYALCFKYGFTWGRDFKGGRADPMHFEYLGTAADARRRKAEIGRALAAFAKKAA